MEQLNNKKNNLSGMAAAVPFLVSVLACLATGLFYIVNYPRRLTLAMLALMAAVTIISLIKAKKNREALIIGAFVVSLIIRADYIIYTPTWMRQHDVIGFGAGFGQAGFIEYFAEKIRLIDFDPRDFWGYFQPPLHHMLAGLWLRFQTFVGRFLYFSYDRCCENVQMLTMFYSCLVTIFGVKILKQLKIEGEGFFAGFLLLAFHPILIIFSGSINNDVLCVALQMISVNFFLKWMEDERVLSLSLCALALGLSMMTKLSAVLLVPSLGIILLWKLIAGRDRFLKFIGQYALFGVISIPIGIWSPIRNFVKFGVPLNYTPEVGEPIEGVTQLQRIFFPGSEVTPFTCMVANGNAYDEFNVPLAILKTSLFGEADFSGVAPGATLVGWLLLLSGAAVCVVTVVAIVGTVRRKLLDAQVTVFMLVYILASYAFIINMCFSIPNFSSQDFRYIAHVLLPEAVFIGVYVEKCGKKIVARAIAALLLVFAVASVLMYSLVGMVSWR